MENAELQVIQTDGSALSVKALNRGDADFALVVADVAYLGFAGQLEDSASPLDAVRGVAVLTRSTVHLIATRQSGIMSPADLNGHRVGIGVAGSGAAMTSKLIMRAFGVNVPADHLESLQTDDARVRRVAEGTLDAAFVMGGVPNKGVQAAIREGVSVIPINGATVERLRNDYPFIKSALFAPGTYSTEAIHTVAIDVLLVCRQSLDPAIVYEFTKAFMASVIEMAPAYPLLQTIDLDGAPGTPLPLHDGARQFYREQELR
jgi:TRAP transporter TAXI family solute receptor